MIIDIYLEPPEYPEPDECTSCREGFLEEELGWINLGVGAVADWQVLGCDNCGAVAYYPPEPDYMPEPDPVEEDWPLEQPVPAPMCPHSNPWGECGACDHESDLAYDSARERRFFKR